MNILYAIQGTGNGHVSRAREILPHLKQHGKIEVLISGTQTDVHLDTPVKYKLHGFGFVFGQRGGVDYWRTLKTMNTRRVLDDIKNFPVGAYDLIINDFEPVTAWACKLKGIPCISLSHQAAFLSSNTPVVADNWGWQSKILKHYAPSTHQVGFHFKAYDEFIHTPVIRSEIRKLEPMDLGHITVYLPAYQDQFLLKFFKQIKELRWEVFSKHCKQAYQDANISVYPVHHEKFNKSLSKAHALLTGGGFEGPSEALFLGKKLAMVPMKNQYEQLCNAEAARRMGVEVIYDLDQNFVNRLRTWIGSNYILKPYFPDETGEIVANLVQKFGYASYAEPISDSSQSEVGLSHPPFPHLEHMSV
ncbi:MAG: hypothetical protein RI924_1141 [Bacteroidota bacterium]|jgi:uncharacterized protein (TIGR00661 family)